MQKFKIVGKSLLGEKYVEGKREKKRKKKRIIFYFYFKVFSPHFLFSSPTPQTLAYVNLVWGLNIVNQLINHIILNIVLINTSEKPMALYLDSHVVQHAI